MIKFWFSNNERTGGNIYNRNVLKVITNRYDVKKIELGVNSKIKGHTYITGLLTKIFLNSNYKDINILDYGIACNLKKKKYNGKFITIFHHYDINETNKKIKWKRLADNFIKNCIHNNINVVVVSKYWKDYLQSKGISNIEIIYNSFDASLYIASKLRGQFLKDNGLNENPIIYIGKNSHVKSKKTYQLIKELSNKYQIVTTGKNIEFEGPINLDLSFYDYVNLLYYSSLTILLTPFEEGWSRIAHESILCGTPVIGNGSGGMKELLELTNQRVRESNELSLDEIKSIVNSGERVKEKDINQIKIFDLNYFKKEWIKLLDATKK